MSAWLLAMLLAAPDPSSSKLPGAVPIATPFEDDAPPPLLDEEPPPPPEPAIATPPVTVSQTISRAPVPSAARPPRPIKWRVDPFIEGGTLRARDHGVAAFASGRTLGMLGAGVRAEGRVGGPVFLGAGVRYGWARGSSGLYDYDVWTEISIHQPAAILRMSVVMLEGVDLVAQLGGGAAFVRTIFDATSYDWESSIDGQNGRQWRVLGAFDARGGVSLYLPKAWLPARGSARVTMGLDLLFGYDFRSKMTVAPKPTQYGEEIRTTGATLGDLALRGFVWSAGIFVRFM
ncbi:MAG TPA: hypothetical protein VG755_26890 [Nannocystaceae bacterium]|nr:hypothetical protein [Nannocystaceae bacterium]